MSSKEQKKPTMEEALGPRMQDIPENLAPEEEQEMKDSAVTHHPETIPVNPTHDEIVEKALAEASVEQAIQSQEPPQRVPPSVKSPEAVETVPIQPETVVMSENTNNPPEKEKPITPALNIDHLHATENSTLESPAPLVVMGKLDLNLQRLISFIYGGEYSVAWVQLHITSISSFPRVLPSPPLWDIPNDVNIAELVYQIVTTAGFVENVWPYLRLVLGTSRDNREWAAAVLTTLALFEGIKMLPTAISIRNTED